MTRKPPGLPIGPLSHPAPRPHTIVAIDPDSDKSGVASLECATRLLEVSALSFPRLIDYLHWAKTRSDDTGQSLLVLIEAGWLNRSNWHLSPRDTPRSAAAKGNHVGRNHEVGRKIAEMCQHGQIPYRLVRPLPLKAGSLHLWRGKDGKITHEELAAFTGITSRTNQEERDAALLAWTYAGLPITRAKEKR